MPNVENLQNSLKLGTSSGYTEVQKNGTLVAKGDATCWDDITGSLVARRIEYGTGKLNYNYANNSISIDKNGSITNSADTLIFNFQIKHNAKLDSIMSLHIHYEQESTTDREFTVKYRIQKNGQSKETLWVTTVIPIIANNVFSYTSGTINQIAKLVNVDLTGANISDMVQFQLCRTDSNSGILEATFIDAHYEIDSLGSRQEFVK